MKGPLRNIFLQSLFVATLAINMSTAAARTSLSDLQSQINDLQAEVDALNALLSDNVAVIADVKPSGTHGGNCVAGVYNQRDLNTTTGGAGFVSVTGNSFTLQPGKYLIEATAPAFVVAQHKAKIVDSSDVDVLLGSVSFSNTSQPTLSVSRIQGVLELAVQDTFRLLHRCAVQSDVVGFGIAAGFGDNEVYSQVRITKLQ